MTWLWAGHTQEANDSLISVEETLGLEPSGMAHVYAAMFLTGLTW